MNFATRRSLMSIALCFLASACASSFAQEPKGDDAANRPRVEEIDLPVIHMKDREGNLVPVPGITYERLRDLILLEKKAGAGGPPQYVLERGTLQAAKESAEALAAEVELDIALRHDDWIRIPLRMAAGIPRAAPEHVGEGEFVHKYDAVEGHSLWLKGAKESRHTLKFKLAFPIRRVQGEHRVVLSPPRANDMRCRIQLAADDRDVTIAAGEGLLTQTRAEGGLTAAIEGAGGDLTLAWREKGAGEISEFFDLTVESKTSFRLETRESAVWIANLRVARREGKITSLFVRLPSDAKLNSTAETGYHVVPAEAAELAERLPSDVAVLPKNTRAVRIDFDRPAEEVEFRLEATSEVEPGTKRTAIEAGGFTVLGAIRQSGTIEIFGPSGWQIKTTGDSALARMEITAKPGESRPAAAYRFTRHPFSLSVEGNPQPARITADPHYEIFVERGRAFWEAKVSYRVRGPRPEQIDLDLQGWKFQSADLNANVTALPAADGKTVRFHLEPSETQDFTLAWRAYRELPAEGKISLPLPRAPGVKAQPLRVAVRTAGDVALLPLIPETTALALDRRREAETNLGSMSFQEIPSNDAPVLVAELQRIPGRESASLATSLSLQGERVAVETQWNHSAIGDPISAIAWSLPAGIVNDVRCEWEDGTVAACERIESPQPSERETWSLPLMPAQLGAIRFKLRYGVNLTIGPEAAVRIPLAVPTGSTAFRLQNHTIRFAESMNAFSFDDESLAAEERTDDAREMSTVRPLSMIVVRRKASAASAAAAVRVERTLWSIDLHDSLRRERFAVRIATNREEITVRWPRETSPERLRVFCNEQPLTAWSLSGNVIRCRLPRSESGMYLLEIWSDDRFESAGFPFTRTEFAPPQLLEADAVSPAYVRLSLDRDRMLWFDTGAYERRARWSFSGPLPQRTARLTARETAQWIGLSPGDEAQGEPRREYLLASLGGVGAWEATIGSHRHATLLAALAAVLCAAAILRAAPRSRQWVIAIIGSLTAALALALPETAAELFPGAMAGAIAASILLRKRASASAREAVKRDANSVSTSAAASRASVREGSRTSTLNAPLADSNSLRSGSASP